MDTRQLGKWGEDAACGYLEDKGLKILGRNIVLPMGEIDIIAREKYRIPAFLIMLESFFPGLKNNSTIHFVEVKTLAMAGGGVFPEQHVDFRKQKKLRQLASQWLHKNGYRAEHPYQVDIIGVAVQPDGTPDICYFPNAVPDA